MVSLIGGITEVGSRIWLVTRGCERGEREEGEKVANGYNTVVRQEE
jgi:hypothetical protein